MAIITAIIIAKILAKQDSRLDFLHDKLDDFLKSLTIPSEVSELYMAILEDTFKSNEGDRKKQIQGLKERIRDQEEKITTMR